MHPLEAIISRQLLVITGQTNILPNPPFHEEHSDAITIGIEYSAGRLRRLVRVGQLVSFSLRRSSNVECVYRWRGMTKRVRFPKSTYIPLMFLLNKIVDI